MPICNQALRLRKVSQATLSPRIANGHLPAPFTQLSSIRTGDAEHRLYTLFHRLRSHIWLSLGLLRSECRDAFTILPEGRLKGTVLKSETDTLWCRNEYYNSKEGRMHDAEAAEEATGGGTVRA